MFLGDQGVGKTSIITRFMYDSFEKNYQVRLVYVVGSSRNEDPTRLRRKGPTRF